MPPVDNIIEEIVIENNRYIMACAFNSRILLANRNEQLDEILKYTDSIGNHYYILASITKEQYDLMYGKRYYLTTGTISPNIAIATLVFTPFDI